MSALRPWAAYLGGMWGVDPSGTAHEAGRWRLGRRPALDGLRGIAIAFVMLDHAGVPWFSWLGLAGVTLFFTLSGFLITCLLLDEAEHDARVDLTSFWMRRARRLLPALLVCVVVVAMFGEAAGSNYVTWSSVTAALTYSTNWAMVFGLIPGALGHLWSLAVEEQFYLTWPIVVVLLWRRPRVLMWVALSGAAVSLLLRYVLWRGGAGEVRISFGSDTRADAILAGCALAVWMRSRIESASRDRLALGGLAVIVLAAIDPVGSALVWLPTVIGCATCVIILGAAQGPGPRWLTQPTLRLVGRRSYALYLWHLPVNWLVAAAVPGGWGERLLLVSGLSWGLAALSWRYVESPFLRPSPVARAGSRISA
jgi:peptidoglycan/LPS O-acetylase OafA/YrhL